MPDERGIFSSGKDKFSQEYFVYFKKIWQSMAGKGPFRRRSGSYRTGLTKKNQKELPLRHGKCGKSGLSARSRWKTLIEKKTRIPLRGITKIHSILG
jgi:hypothetical protein